MPISGDPGTPPNSSFSLTTTSLACCAASGSNVCPPDPDWPLVTNVGYRATATSGVTEHLLRFPLWAASSFSRVAIRSRLIGAGIVSQPSKNGFRATSCEVLACAHMYRPRCVLLLRTPVPSSSGNEQCKPVAPLKCCARALCSFDNVKLGLARSCVRRYIFAAGWRLATSSLGPDLDVFLAIA